MTFLFSQTFPALSTPPHAKDWSNVSVPSQASSDGILRAVNQMVEHLQQEMQKLPEVCTLKFKDICPEKLMLFYYKEKYVFLQTGPYL